MTVLQRPVKGSRISSFYPVKTVPPLSSLDSAFQLQEYISLLIRSNVHDVDTIVSIPGKSSAHDRAGSDGSDKGEDKDGKSDVTVDEASWIYEQLRRLAQDLSHPLITTLQQECTRATCPEMKAGEWLYLCVAHGSDGAMEQCCAIDYILHTLDSATALLNSPRAFPSRLSVPAPSTRHFSSLARRLGRIFAHAYYHHREAFEQAEAESSLYARFLALTSKFDLVPNEFLVIPPRSAAVPEEGEEESGQEYPSRNLSETSQRLENERDWLTSTTGIEPRTLRGISPPGPAGEARNPSPRKGRSRTDTMVYSEAINVAEELAKGEGFTEADLDKAISQERLLSTIEPTSADASALTSEPEESSVPEASEPTEEPAAETDRAPSHPTEIQLEIAAPPPAEPAIPSDSGDSHTTHESDGDSSAEASEETPSEEPEEPEAEVAEASSEAAQESDVTDNAEDASEPVAEGPVESSSEAAEHTDEAPAPTTESDIGTSEVPKDEAATEPSPAPESAPEAEPKELSSANDTATTPADPEHDKPSDSDG